LVKKNSSALSAKLSRQEWQALARMASAVFELASAMERRLKRTRMLFPFSKAGMPSRGRDGIEAGF
jgi:hypothetical protein